MNERQTVLWNRLEQLTIGAAAAELDFTLRLARESRWSKRHAVRVMGEYKKFLYLASEAGHPVTPSDAVDQAWHLHLVYTRDYWEGLCGDVLGRALHHGPTRGGRREDHKFVDWYERTLESYRATFGEPPADVWPPSDERFRVARFVRVSAADHYLLRKADVAFGMAASALAVAIVFQVGCTIDDGMVLLGGVLTLGLVWTVGMMLAAASGRSGVARKKNEGDGGASVDAGCGSGSKAHADGHDGGGDGGDASSGGDGGSSGCGSSGCGGGGCGGGGCGGGGCGG